ncbi:hypothetical protein QYM36_014050 [Artemia franciscana]|uniref:Uncharacterized protein n=1 Tax=Artemia franciscana TaxID=6661 RepID=A0AA88HAB1_ARTSF|nr:hypothetical protein QYM36_014050 [Artemia franciscana]
MFHLHAACPDELFNKIVEAVKFHKLSNFIETFKEINIDYIPYESQVFSLDFPDGFQCYYNRNKASQRTAAMERMAEQIATLCSTLGEYPAVRYRAGSQTMGHDPTVGCKQILSGSWLQVDQQLKARISIIKTIFQQHIF